MQIQLFLVFLVGAAGISVSLRHHVRRLATDRRQRFLRQVRVALDVPESEW